MCGRFALDSSPEKLKQTFDLKYAKGFTASRYNIAPSQEIPVIVQENSFPVLRTMKWGLVPFWAKDPAIGNKLINARAETLAEKPSFRQALTRRRCLIPASGFFEWKSSGKQKTPLYIRLKNTPLFSMAGLWEEWKNPEGKTLITCTIITVPPNPFMEIIHNRMPAIVLPSATKQWLGVHQPSELIDILKPCPQDWMQAEEVRPLINQTSNDSVDCIRPVQMKKSEDPQMSLF
ncbi:MAG: SOS response-associated peptidase [SAR324 cluster bacterium]|nr:SOS response-associated peptidase [SAR324 cluster bacterium]